MYFPIHLFTVVGARVRRGKGKGQSSREHMADGKAHRGYGPTAVDGVQRGEGKRRRVIGNG